MIHRMFFVASFVLVTTLGLPCTGIAASGEVALTIVEEGMETLTPATACKCACRVTRQQLEACGYKGNFQGLTCTTVNKGSPVTDPCKGKGQNTCTSGTCTVTVKDKNGITACAIGHHGFDNSCELKKPDAILPHENGSKF